MAAAIKPLASCATLGRTVRALRGLHDVRQFELARAIGWSPARLCQLELGREVAVTDGDLKKMADALYISVDLLRDMCTHTEGNRR